MSRLLLRWAFLLHGLLPAILLTALLATGSSAGYLTWVAPEAWLRVVFVVTVVAASGCGILAHLVNRLPGGVTSAERRSAERSRARRLAPIIAGPMISIVLIVLIAATIARPREPIEAVLFSRVRIPVAEEKFPKNRGSRTIDLGPIVDDVLSKCRSMEVSWTEPSVENRNQLRKELVLLRVEDKIRRRPYLVNNEVALLPTRDNRMPRWLVEHTEVTVAAIALRARNVRAVRVAAAPTSEDAGWLLAAKLLTSDERPVVAEIPKESLGDPVIRKLFDARRTQNRDVRFFAHIEGGQKGSVKARIGVDTPGKAIEKPFELEAGPVHRLELLKFRAEDLGELFKAGMPEGTAVTDENKTVKVLVRDIAAARPKVFFYGSTDSALKIAAELLHGEDKPPMLRGLASELTALDIAVPEPTEVESEIGCVTVHYDTQPHIVIAKSKGIADQAHKDIQKRKLITTPPARVVTQNISRPTSNSWLDTAIPPEWSESRELLWEVDQTDRASAGSSEVNPPAVRESVHASAGLVAIGRHGTNEYVAWNYDLIGDEPKSADEPVHPGFEPAAYIAAVRTWCWACQHVINNSDESSGITKLPASDDSRPVAPLLTVADTNRGDSTDSWLDILVVIVLTLYLAMWLALQWQSRPF